MHACLVPVCLKTINSKQTCSGELAQYHKGHRWAPLQKGHVALVSCMPISLQETVA